MLQDVCALLDVKANTEDVNKVLVDVCNELDRKAAAEDLQSAVRDQSIMNASLCVDMSFGRWIWKSGKTKAGNGVPWNIQSLNTDPDNFIWEKDKARSTLHPLAMHMMVRLLPKMATNGTLASMAGSQLRMQCLSVCHRL